LGILVPVISEPNTKEKFDVDDKIKIINNIVEQKTEYPCAVEVIELLFNIIKFSIIFGIFNNKECLRILPPTLTGQSRHGQACQSLFILGPSVVFYSLSLSLSPSLGTMCYCSSE